ncbi:MAG TPA: hypothetical protein VK168_14740 [Saprospiraceae bacterium]|nr:hypothetical protein [Saprospiraceae bacterium]
MQLEISPDKTMGALQKEFSEAFAGLKLAFFSKPHGEHKGSAAKFLIQDKDLALSQLSPELQAGVVNITPELVVWQLEKQFEEQFGLHVQLFRKSGRTWLETSVSDNLTLAEQMERSAASENIHQEFVDPMDYREQA